MFLVTVLTMAVVSHGDRYIALQNDKQGNGPLASYFKGEVLSGRDTDIFTSNMCELLSLHLQYVITHLHKQTLLKMYAFFVTTS